MTNTELIKTEAMMCDESTCSQCPLDHTNNGKDISCYTYKRKYPGECITIIEKWSKEHFVSNAKWWAMHFSSLGIDLDPNEFKKECPRLFKGEEKCPQTGEVVGAVISCMDCAKWWDEEYQGDKK